MTWKRKPSRSMKDHHLSYQYVTGPVGSRGCFAFPSCDEGDEEVHRVPVSHIEYQPLSPWPNQPAFVHCLEIIDCVGSLFSHSSIPSLSRPDNTSFPLALSLFYHHYLANFPTNLLDFWNIRFGPFSSHNSWFPTIFHSHHVLDGSYY